MWIDGLKFVVFLVPGNSVGFYCSRLEEETIPVVLCANNYNLLLSDDNPFVIGALMSKRQFFSIPLKSN